ncbi:hypothetical protein BW261_26040, partial [Klebsiella aerogenes]|uniref:hypothetical protein n=1 Tax=Klebsiella aerogenes TaxID=548 RepID=UPI0015887675
ITSQECPANAEHEEANKQIPQIVVPDASNINVGLKLEQRKKGLLWYPTYKVNFAGAYDVSNKTENPEKISLNFSLPDKSGVYDNLKVKIDNSEIVDLHPIDGVINTSFQLPAKETRK